MSQTRPLRNNVQFSDSTYTKIFVGGLAWKTQRDTMKLYFEQFGEILEAVVITDKNTGRSKGYGFVTFKDPDSAMRACHNPSPVIDGRTANCNLASLGANKNRPPVPHHGMGRLRATSGFMTQPFFQGSSSTYFHHSTPHPYSAYGYTGYYSQDAMYNNMNYYGLYRGQHWMYPNFYPTYNQYSQSGQAPGFGVQYPQMLQYSYLSSPVIVPSSGAMATTSTDSTITANMVQDAISE
ncbi:RNA-binding protein 24-like [Olea europaea var. sylvestris]|uniref:RNA-binding protein 24-like n=1 Tax=Olea europaea var. sylvestris TaxID=158386 RepID=UPI000C1CE2E7|nr:RNA-binding protein 24-like [Olea europaea var. sylvestris]XP_022861235.1 RNA-binding protein 24-like [Olea europaea var. sylvestris]